MAGCSGLKLSIYAENLPNDVRKRYRKKLKYSHDDLLDPYELSSGWLDDPSVWTDLQFGDIYRLLLPNRVTCMVCSPRRTLKLTNFWKLIITYYCNYFVMASVLDYTQCRDRRLSSTWTTSIAGCSDIAAKADSLYNENV